MTAYRTFTRCALATIVLPVGLALPASAPQRFSTAAGTSYSEHIAAPIDGRIVFSGDDCQLYTVNPDGSALVQVTHFSSRCAVSPAWSPDSTRIAFQLYTSDFDRSSIYSMDADGSHLRLEVTDGADFFDRIPTFVPDGNRIVYSRCRPDPPGGCAIYSVRVDGTNPRQVTRYRRGAGDWFPQVSPNGRWLAFSRLGWKGIQAQIWLMPMDRSARAEPITPIRLGAVYPRWAPDSQHLYLQGKGSNGFGYQLFRTPVSGSHLTQLTFTPWPNGNYLASASPSGRYLAFVSDRRHPDACCDDLFEMRADGSHQHLVTGEIYGRAPSWGTAPLQARSTVPVQAPTAAEIARFHRVQAVEDQLGGSPTSTSR